MEAKHTPTPWRADDGVIFATPVAPGSTGEIVHCLDVELEELGFNLVDAPLPFGANADFIVRACNSHDALVEALKAALARFGDMNGQVSAEVWNDNWPAIKVCREALALAGETP